MFGVIDNDQATLLTVTVFQTPNTIPVIEFCLSLTIRVSALSTTKSCLIGILKLPVLLLIWKEPFKLSISALVAAVPSTV